MANTVLTHAMIAREAAALLEEASPFVNNVNKARQDEFGDAVNGYKRGDTVTIKLPPTGVVYDGSLFAGGGSAPDFVEESVSLTLGTQKHIPLTFGAKEKLLTLTDFRERVLMPQMTTLAAMVEADLIARAAATVPNLVGTPGTTPNTMKTFSQARAKLQRNLCPDSPRYMMMTDDVNVELVDSTKVLFNPPSEIEKMFYSGTFGKAQGAGWYECVNMPVLSNGTKVTGVTVNGAGQVGTTLNIGGLTAGDTIKAGSVFTFPLVNEAHPLTGADQGAQRQFVVTADFTATGTTGSISIYPAIDIAAPNKTVTASPANSAAITFVGAASTGYKNSLMWHRDAFTAAFAPLPVLASCEGYTARLPSGISVRVMTFGNGQTDTESTRIDVLYGFTRVRPLHACRVIQ
jgi:P22 coat protein - gene protein 5